MEIPETMFKDSEWNGIRIVVNHRIFKTNAQRNEILVSGRMTLTLNCPTPGLLWPQEGLLMPSLLCQCVSSVAHEVILLL
jgi:hypothetical protein